MMSSSAAFAERHAPLPALPPLVSLDSAVATAADRVGSVLDGTWHLDAVLNIGSSSVVYQATHQNGTRAALKVLHPEYTFNERLRCLLNREAQILSRAEHPGVVRLLSHGVTKSGELFLAMELLQGETLAGFLARSVRRTETKQALLLTLLVLDALAALHERGLVHREITTENVFITQTGDIKLLGLGLARASSDAESDAEIGLGTVLGTPGFMPPEQAQGLNEEVDSRSDVWAVGALLFELLTGLPVHFEATTLFQKQTSGAFQPAPKLGSLLPSSGVKVQTAVDCALAFNKADRFRDAGAMRAALLRLLILAPGRASPRPSGISYTPTPSLLRALQMAFEQVKRPKRRRGRAGNGSKRPLDRVLP